MNIIELMLIPFPIIIFASYLVLFEFLALTRRGRAARGEKRQGKPQSISVLIPAFNEGKTIARALRSLQRQQDISINRIVIVDDHSTDDTRIICQNLQQQDSRIEIRSRQGSGSSKVRSYLLGLETIRNEDVALLDADTILEATAIVETLEYMRLNGADYGTCLIAPLSDRPLVYKCICWDRLFRQRVLQVARGMFGCANLPGCFAVVRKSSFLPLLEDSFQEDLIATYKLIRQGQEVVTLPEVLAFEWEKGTLMRLFFQRARWTIGNISAIKHFLLAVQSVAWKKKMILVSYPLLWYLLNYYLTFLLLLGLVTPAVWLGYLVLASIYGVGLIEAKVLMGKLEKSDIITLPMFLLVFPFVVSLALGYALFTVVRKRRLVFPAGKLYER